MEPQRFRQTLGRAFWIPLGIGVLLAAILFFEVRYLGKLTASVEHADQIITLSQRIDRTRIDQETGLRAFLLTHDLRFLDSFNEGRRQAPELEATLRQLVSDNPEQSERNENSYRAFAAWSAWADQAIAMAAAGENTRDIEFQLRGKQLMDQYRQMRQAFTEREQQLRDQGAATSRRSLVIVNASIGIVVIVFVLGFGLIGRRQLTRLSRSFTEALHRAEGRGDWLHTTLTSIGDAVISTDADGRITLVNPVAEKLTGWRLPETQGKPLAEVFRIVNEETGQTVENPVDKVRRLNRVVGLANHTILISKSGQKIAIDDSGAPIFNSEGALAGVVLVFRDVTELRAAQRAMARLAAIVEFSGDAIVTKNLDGIIQTWNGGAERLFGYTADEIIGKPVTVLFPPDRLREEDWILHNLHQGRPSERLDTVRVTKDGRPIQVSVSVSPIKDAEGRIIGASKVIHDLTALAAARDALAREKDLLTTTLSSIGDAVIATDAKGHVTFLNMEAERLTGWNAADAEGRALPEILRIVNEQTRKPVENPVEKVLRHGMVVGLANHTILIAKDGREIPIDDSAAPIRHSDGPLQGVVLVFRNVAEQRGAQRKLMEQARLLELTADAVILRDEGGRIAYWNKGAEQLYGWDSEGARGKIVHELLHTKFPQPLAEIEDRVRREKHWQGELVHTRKDGMEAIVFSRWVQADNDSDTCGPRCFMEINTDITRRKQLESALQSNEKLALAGRLSATIAHEIHNPLDVLSHILFLIDQKLDGNSEVKRLIETARSQARQVAEISRNMLSLHRESRSVSTVNLSELLEGVVALIEETIARGRRKIQIVPGFTGEVEGFPSELRQVFTNVIKNAVEATEDGGEIKIYTEAAREYSQDGVLIRVVDSGSGIPEELKSSLFSPFVSSKKESGTGLGLWVSRSIVEKHGGSIWLASSGTDHQGTTASIFLPLKAQPPKAEAASPG